MRPEDLLPELFPGATGGARMLLAIVLAFQGSDSATPASIAALSGCSDAAIRRDLRSLAALDLIECVRPRGTRASRLRVKENARTKRLLAALMRSFDLQTG
jgi:DeoR/GlpR family transcriptional regulator of sugar metabolism